MSIVMNGSTGLTITGTATASTFGGVTTTAVNDGQFSGGTYAPVTAGGNMRFITNNGPFVLVCPSGGSLTSFTMVIQITNGSAPGAITLSGFTKVSGAFTTTIGDDFMLFITVCNGFSVANIVTLQ